MYDYVYDYMDDYMNDHMDDNIDDWGRRGDHDGVPDPGFSSLRRSDDLGSDLKIL
jgi:hypothetical protein